MKYCWSLAPTNPNLATPTVYTIIEPIVIVSFSRVKCKDILKRIDQCVS